MDDPAAEYDYHKDFSCVSSSMLEDFFESAARFEQVYVKRAMLPKAATEAMNLGTCVHTLLLEKELWDERIIVVPKVDGRTTEGTAQKKELADKHADKIQLTEPDFELVQEMAYAVMQHEDAGRLLSIPGDVEKVYKWEDAATGLPCKCKLDVYLKAGTVLDIKATESPHDFGRAAYDWGYHRRAAHYINGLLANKVHFESFLFVVVGKQQPCECSVYRLEGQELELGFKQNRELLTALAQSYATNVWRSEWTKGTRTLAFPPWAWKSEGRLLS
jgi:hypothetical protein